MQDWSFFLPVAVAGIVCCFFVALQIVRALAARASEHAIRPRLPSDALASVRAFVAALYPSGRSGPRLRRWAARALLPVCLLGLGAAVAFSFGTFQMPSSTVSLPIEVMGPDGKTVSVQVNASSTGDVEALYLKAHSIGYPYHIAESRGFPDKASIRLNGGAWLDVNNSTVTCKSPESTVRCINGPMHTVRFTIPISDLGSLNDGANTLDFRFNYAHPSGELGSVSSGYRILDLQLQTAGGSDRIDGTTFAWDDPGAWTAPAGADTQADVDAGAQLWSQRDLLIDGWNGPQITASCADCHVKNGYDLQYFAYSNESIVQRSRFHGLSETEGKQIAAYIRSIDVTTEGGQVIDPPGRPWNPPYQPGPTAAASRPDGADRTQGQSVDDLDPIYWAAGSGVEWALDSDAEMKQFLFPNGVTPDAFSVSNHLNMRETPVAIQMPDWNEWLPTVHPMDVWGSTFTSSDTWTHFENKFEPASADGSYDGVRFEMQKLWKNLKKDFRPSSAPAPWDSRVDAGVAILSRVQWGLTKTWGALQPNHLENDAPGTYGDGAESLQWPSLSRIIFDQAPHIQGEVKGETTHIMDRYHDTAWYQHQLTLNAGSGISTRLKPMDWKYHYGHLGAVQEFGPHAWRYVSAYMKVLNVADQMSDSYSSTEPEGWYLRHMTPAIIDRQHHWADILEKGLTADEYRRVLNVVLSAMAEGMTQEPLSEWARLADNQDGIEPESHTPQVQYRYDRFTYADHFWTSLEHFGEYGAAYEVLLPLAEWAQQAWPNGDWMGRIEPFKDNPGIDTGPGTSPPSVSMTAPLDGTTLTAPSGVTLEADASDDGSVQQVEFFAGATSLGTVTASPYTLTWSAPAPGTYTLTAKATDDTGETTTSDPVSLEVQAADDGTPGPVDPGVNYAYYETKVWSVPDFSTLTPTATGITNNFVLTPAQQEDRYAFRYDAYLEVPADGDYTFTLGSDDGSKLWINGALLVDNDGTHGYEEKTGTVTLTQGYHKIEVGYFEGGGGQSLSVNWAGPGFTREGIPDNRLYPKRPSGADTQTIPLAAGWNLVSSSLTPADPAMEAVFADLGDNLIMVKDEVGNVYSPAYGVTTLNEWTPEEGYMVYVTAADTLTLTGPDVAADAPIELAAGWNLVSYLPDGAVNAEDAFASIGSALVLVKDYAGRVYYPDPDLFVNEIGSVEPGQGYKVYVSDPTTLTYPPASSGTASSDPAAADPDAPSKRAGSSTGAARGVSVSATVLVRTPGLPDGTRITAQADGRAVGSGTVADGRAALTVRGDDRLTPDRVEGARPGDALTLLRGPEQQPVAVAGVQNVLTGTSPGDDLTFAPDALLVAETEAPVQAAALERNFPNPVRDATTIGYTLPEAEEVTLEVYNVLGQRVVTLVDERQDAGRHTVRLQADRLGSGVYFYRLSAGAFEASHKLTVVR